MVVTLSVLLSTFLLYTDLFILKLNCYLFSLQEIATWYAPSSDPYSGTAGKIFLVITYPDNTSNTIFCECCA